MYFTPLLSTKGGIERTLTDKANYLAEKGHEVTIVTYEHEGILAYNLVPSVKHVDLACHFFEIYRYPFYRRFVEVLRQKHLFRLKMRKQLADSHPDVIVITIPNTEIFINDLMVVANGIPLIIESHLAYGRQVLHCGLMEKLMCRLFNPMVAIRKADLLIALTKGDANCWRLQDVCHVEIIPNPVTNYGEIMSKIKKTEGRIISVGRLTPQKRFDRLIEAFSLIADRYPGWFVDIYGDGHEKDNLQSLIMNKNLSHRIHILFPTSDIYTEYKRSQFFVLSSDFEGFGLVLIEAMACGIPVISTDCPYGPSEIIDEGESGILSKMDVVDLAKKMEFLMANDGIRQQMGESAYHASARYRKESIMPQWEKVYMQIASNSK